MIGKFQKEPERKFKKSWKWMLSATSLFLVAFMALFAFKADDRSEAAPAFYIQTSGSASINENESLRIENGGTYNMKSRSEYFILGVDVPEGETFKVGDYTAKWKILQGGEGVATFGNFSRDGGLPEIPDPQPFSTPQRICLNDTGIVTITVDVESKDKGETYTISFTLNVEVSIVDYINRSDGRYSTMIARPGETTRSLIMSYSYEDTKEGVGEKKNYQNYIELGFDAKEDGNQNKINLNFGHADDRVATRDGGKIETSAKEKAGLVTWHSDDPSVVDFAKVKVKGDVTLGDYSVEFTPEYEEENQGFKLKEDDGGELVLRVNGPGYTTIWAEVRNGETTTGQVSTTAPMTVFVRPEIKSNYRSHDDYTLVKEPKEGGIPSPGELRGWQSYNKESLYSDLDDAAENLFLRSGDRMYVSGLDANSAVNSKLTWVIYKTVSNGDNVFVRDSLGNVNTAAGYTADTAKLTWRSGYYTFDARAGTYRVLFFVATTYTYTGSKLSDYDGGAKPGCREVRLGDSATVLSNFTDKDIVLQVGDIYSLVDALNITLSDLNEFFIVNPDGEYMEGKGDITNFAKHEPSTQNIEALRPGKVQFVVKTKSNINASGLKEFEELGEIKGGAEATRKITITISDRLIIDYEKPLTMTVGGDNVLRARWASGLTSYDNDKYTWTSSNTEMVSIEDGTYGTQAYIKANAKTTGEGVTITVSWTSETGEIYQASVVVVVGEVTNDFTIEPSSLEMVVGEPQLVKIEPAQNVQNVKVQWLSSDPEIATVEDQGTTSPSAMITPLKPGKTTIIAYNESANNGTYAVCEVTVLQPATGLDIIIDGTSYTDQTYETVLSTGYVFASVVANPEDTTETEFVWTSSDTGIATVDETGRITLVGEGITMITVSTASGSHSAKCWLSVVAKPITSITTDVSELDMIVGDTYTVSTQIEPADASNNTLTWESSDQGVANVDNAGRITATGVGTAVIRVIANLAPEGGRPAEASINVTVRNRLTSIAFDSNVTYINVGGTKQINVIFTPASDVNTNVTFRSSDESIFTVDANGVITGVAVGQAILTCTAEDLGEAGVISCIVHVTENEVLATDFVLTPAEGIVYIGSTLQIEKTFTPEDATDQFVTWTSSDPAIATVNQAGLVTGVALGKVTITAAYTNTPDGVPWIRTSSVEVQETPVYATDFDVTPASQNILVGEKFTIVPVFTPANATNQNVDYQSLDEGVVSVDEKGVVTGIGAGDAVIQAQAEDGGFIATCAVHVDNAIKFSLSPEKREIAVGKSFKLKKVTDPANAKKTATWSTSNSAIARVNSNGKVTGRRIGSCTIRCVLTNYNQRATCRVKVAKLRSTIKLENKNIRIGVGQTYRLKKTVWSNNTHNPGVKWKTSNKRIVAVSGAGKLTGKRVGLAKVTAVTNDSVRAKAVCKVRVIQRVSKISLNTDYMVVYVGGVKKLNVKYRPAGATIKKVKFKSGNSKIARVTGSGRVRGIAEGDTFVTATAADGSNKRARCYVKVMDAVPATSIVVAQTNMTMQRGDSAKISYRVLPENTSDSLKFASDNKRVAKVNNKGRVKAVGTGNAVITIMSTSGVTSTVDVNVVAFNKSTLNIRQFDTETLIVHGASDTVTWYSSNARVATVDDAGKVVGRSPGTAYIYAYINGCRVSCRVVVSALN